MKVVQEVLRQGVSEPGPPRHVRFEEHQAAAGRGAGRVLMVLESLYPVSGGGSETQVRTLCRHLLRRGVQARVVVPMVKRGPQVREDMVDRTPVTRLPCPSLRGLGTVVILLRLIALLVRQRHQYDAIHAHIAHYMAAICCVVGRWLGKPVVVKVAGGHEMGEGLLDSGSRNPRIRLMRWMLRRATYIQATSAEMAQRLLACGFDSAQVQRIPNAVDVERFRPREAEQRARMDLPIDCRRIGVFVGRLVEEKWLEGFFTAWARALGPDDDIGLVVVGDGSMRESLAHQVRTLGCERRIAFVGFSRDVDAYLRAADFGVLPSLVEGLSNTLLEYMATALPVIGSRISGTEDLIEDGRSGWLFPAGDVDAAARALRRMADADVATLHQMGGRARQRIAAVAGTDAVIERLLGLYGIDDAAGAARVRTEGL